MHGRWIAVLLILASTAATPAAADVDAYAGLAFSDVELEVRNAIQSFSIRGSESAPRFFGGLLVGEHFAVEGSYIDASGFDSTFPYAIPGVITFNVNFEADYQIVAARAIGKFYSGQFEIFGGAGAYDADLDGDATYPIFTDGSGSLVATVSRNESGLTAIAGAAYPLGDAAAMRLDYEWFDMDAGLETYILSFGFTYRFD
jgi:opacity protein-like surface antigen